MDTYHDTQERITALMGELPQDKRTTAAACWTHAMTWLQREYPELSSLIVPRALAEEKFWQSCLRVAHKNWQGHEAEIIREAKLHLLQEHLAYQRMLQAEGTART